MKSTVKRRRYSSSHRRRQAEATRQAILEAYVEQLSEEGFEDFSVAQVASRAGVAVSTVYHHFPNRGALVAALDEHLERSVLRDPDYGHADELAGNTREMWRDADRHEAIFRAQAVSEAGRAIGAASRPARHAKAKLVLGEVTAHLDPAEAERAKAVIVHLRGLATWLDLKDSHGLSGDEAAAAMSWAVGVLVDDLRRRDAALARGGPKPRRGGGGGRAAPGS